MLAKIERTTMTSRVVDNLVDFIWQSKLQPGESLPSAEQLQETLGVSRPVIREALKILEGRNMVETVNGKGTILRDTDPSTLADFFHHAIQLRPRSTLELMEVRRGIEVQSASLASMRRTDEQAAAMGATVAKMETATTDVSRYAALDMQLHMQIAEASQNQMLYFLVNSIREALRKSMIEGMQSRQSNHAVSRVQELHHLLIDAIIRKDSDRAAAMMSLHFDEAIAALSRSKA